MTFILRMDHLGGIAHAFCTFLMLGDRVPRTTWVRGLHNVQYIRAIFSYKMITDLMLTKTIVAMVTRSFLKVSERLPKTFPTLPKAH